MLFRVWMRAVAVALALAAPTWAAKADRLPAGDFKVVMLGTGTPPPFMHRFGPGTLVVVNNQYLLFDVGRGVTQRLWQDRVPLGRIDQVFLTHLHSDHVVGIPDLLLTGWLMSPFGRRKGKFHIMGPAGTESLMTHLVKAYEWDINTRIADQKFSRETVTPAAKDITPGVVYEKDGVRVTAIEVNHGPLIKPAYGYRIDYDGRSVVLSGDTKFNDNLIAKAAGADLFIHAVAAARKELLAASASWQRILSHHTEPEDVGRAFAMAKPKMAAFYHVVVLTNGKIKPPSVADLISRARTTYKGPLIAGKDRMIFHIRKDGVKMEERK